MTLNTTIQIYRARFVDRQLVIQKLDVIKRPKSYKVISKIGAKELFGYRLTLNRFVERLNAARGWIQDEIKYNYSISEALDELLEDLKRAKAETRIQLNVLDSQFEKLSHFILSRKTGTLDNDSRKILKGK